MARLGTALDRHHDPPPRATPWRAAVTERVSAVLARRDSTAPARLRRRPQANPVGDRLLAAVELAAHPRRRAATRRRRSAHARTLEQRLVAVLARRLPGAAAPPPGGAFARLARRAAGDRLPATRVTTLRALAVSLLARGVVRALVRFVRLLTRGFLGAPIRRLARLLARRAVRARAPRQAAGLLALLLGLIALARRLLGDRLGALPQLRFGGLLLLMRLLRGAFGLLRGPVGVLLRVLARVLLRALGRRFAALRGGPAT